MDFLADVGETERLPAGATVFRQGDCGVALYIVLDGRVDLYDDGPTGRPQRQLHEFPEYAEPGSFRGYGRWAGAAPVTVAAATGTYATNWNDFHLRQQGSAISGCYEYDEGLFEGTIEGQVAKLTWKQAGGAKQGPAQQRGDRRLSALVGLGGGRVAGRSLDQGTGAPLRHPL